MFNVGPIEIVVLALVGLIVLGPDKLPGLARDAARMLRTLRDLATGARQQLRDELGPEFADIDLRNLNPRTAVQRAVFGDDLPDLRKYDPRRYDANAVMRDTIFGEDDEDEAEQEKPVSMTKQPPPEANGNRPRPRPKPGPGRTYDTDAT
ncbi:MAG TPA: sec-independent translocase [Jatrophihabitans sp.]|nr:sec-independent translocase [Jatrophihabitans sp.]